MSTKLYLSLALKLVSLGLVVAAGSFWAGAGVDRRPKYRDEQTLVGGTIWSQILIPIGLLISKTVGEEFDTFTHGYFLMTGLILLVATGLTLIIHECRITRPRHDEQRNAINQKKIVRFKKEYDKIYLSIAILILLASVFTFAEFIFLMF